MRAIADQEEILRAQRTDANAATIDPQLKQLERKKQLYVSSVLPCNRSRMNSKNSRCSKRCSNCSPSPTALRRQFTSSLLRLLRAESHAERSLRRHA